MLKNFGKRALSLILCFAMITALLPRIPLTAQAVTAQQMTGKTVDPSTLEDWMQYFGPDAITTEYTGGVWTDKSVFKSVADYLAADGTAAQLSEIAPESFLVALSAIAANQQITGHTTKPTDTVFVLDVSNSMDQQGYVPGMIEAANNAIKTLMDGNAHNRVGVVLYSGSSQQGNSQTGTAMVLLPLDHYTSGNSDKTFLRYTGTSDTTVYVATNVKNSAGQTVNSSTGKNTNGGTYTQNGVYKAWQMFEALGAEDTVIPAGQPQAGTKRIPAIVLMTDGQPTAGDTTYYDIDSSNVGDGTTPSTHNANRLTFLNQLTLAWVKAKLANKYGIAGNEALIYTVGLNTSTNASATDVLNPAASTNTTVNGWWNTFINATPNNRGQVTFGSGDTRWTGYKSSDGMITSASQRIYPTAYFSADNTAALATAFSKIAETLTEKTPYVTLVAEGSAGSLDGYVTIEDQLGVLMNVKDVKGLVLGDRIFTGAELAKGMAEGDFGSAADPKAYGDELVRTVRERLGIDDVAVAQDLIRSAWRTGQLSYTDANNFSNYIGWYESADGKYLGHWQESDGYEGVGAPEGAVYINRSYGYLGSEEVGNYLTDMMHVVVMVRTKIATGDQAVVYKIPASLIPTVQYNVTLDGVDATSPESITREAADPLRLLVEVGLRDEINTVNLEAKAAEYVANGGHIHKNSDGTYSFYTNRWGDGDGGEVNYDLPLTHLVTESHFHPALDNVRYYFVDDTLVYSDTAGTVYNGAAAPSGSGYYYARNYYEKNGNSVSYVTEYVPLESVNAAKAVKGAEGWYVPAGTPQQMSRFAVAKSNNATSTLNYAWNPVVLHNQDGYNSYAFLGNNGTFTVAPAQGISLSKTVAQAVDGAPTQFTFTVELSQAAPQLQVTDADGNPLHVATVDGATITLQLSDGQTVYLTGIPTGTTYKVTETQSRYYTASAQGATGTVVANTVKPVTFTNTPKGYGSLVVSKDVVYPAGFAPTDAHNNKEFTLEVAFSGDTEGMVVPSQAQSGASNVYTVTLKDTRSVTFSNIPEGVTYSVSEPSVPEGYTLTETRYTDTEKTISANDVDQVQLVNTYAPAPAKANLKIQGTKTVENGQWPDGAAFTIRLWQVYDFGSGDVVKTNRTATVTAGNASYSIDISDIEFDKEGIYYIRVAEDIPEGADRIADMAYDRTMGLFYIQVTDRDADGKLEILDNAVIGYQDAAVTGDATNGWIVSKDFVNVVTKDLVYVDIQKSLDGYTGNHPPLADINFGLFENMNDLHPAFYGLTDGEGKATLLVPVTASGIGSGKTYYLREIAPDIPLRILGMSYDESWIYALRITWDDVENQAVVEYAPIEDGVVGTYAPYTRESVSFAHTNPFTTGVESTPAIRFSGEKTVNGGSVGDRTFQFSVYEADSTFRHGDTPTQTVRNSGGSITFEPIKYRSEGMKYMVIKEQATDLGGVSIDLSEYHVSVLIEKYVDNGVTKLRVADGYPAIVKLGATEAVAQDAIDFDNSYTITGSVTEQIQGTKTLTGRIQHTGEFTFELRKDGQPVETVTNRADGSFLFSQLTFTPEDIGTHTYTVVEKQPDGAQNNKYQGVTYSTKVYEVVITVSDNGQGGLRIRKTVDGSENGKITFQNSYSAGSTTARITGTKTWYNEDTKQNIPLTGDEFTFELYRSDETFSTQGSLVKTVQNGADGKISLSLTYNKPGDHYYILREAIGDDEATSYDNTRYFIRVLVSDDGVGNLENLVTVTKGGSEGSTVTFGNRYTPKPVTATITGTKNLTGRDLVEGEFTFLLLDENEQELDRTENVGNTFTFQTMSYENTGVYTYKVIEHVPDPSGIYKGITYDLAIRTVTVTVTDESGVLKAEVGYPAGGLAFNNTYEGADTNFSISGKKNYNKPLTAGQFSFELVDKNGKHIATATNDAQGDFTFHNIPLAAAGDYEFTVREKIPTDVDANNKRNGITYSDKQYKVTVSVTDPGHGQLVAGTPTVENGPIVFENTYTVEPTQAIIRANKVLRGRALKAGEFTFVLEGEGEYRQTTNRADGTIEFLPIDYSAPGEYTYTVYEVVNGLGGVDYDNTTHTVYVDVTDNGNGTLSVDVIYANGNPTFTNTYTVTGQTQFSLEGVKVLEGRQMNSQDVFTFQLKDAGGNVIRTVDAQNGSFRFGDVQLNTLGKHTFTVNEKLPADAVDGVKNGITYSTQVYTVEVTVSDNGIGGMTAGTPIVSYNGVDVAQMTFTNTYKVTQGTKTDILGIKRLTGNKQLEANMFTFELYAGTDTTAQPIATAKNAADGTIEFKDVALNTLGVNTFTVKEQAPEGGKFEGITYSTLTYTVTVETTDNGIGGMTAGVPVYYLGSVQQSEMVFINAYAVEGEAYGRIEGQKTLEGGKKLNENDFTFELYEGDTVTGTPKALAQNAQSGSFGFDLSFQAPGTYTYTVRELAPEGYYADNIHYSQLVYHVSIQVEDNGKGGMTVKTPVYTLEGNPVEEMAFVNTYEPDEVPFDLEIQKILQINSGKGVGLNGFKFQVWNQAELLTELTSNTEGKAKLSLVAGKNDIGNTYQLKVVEVNTGVRGVTYSTVEHQIVIVVGQNEDGTIRLDLTLNGNQVDALQMSFTNIYDRSVTPDTGDNFQIGLFIGLMATSAMGLAVLLLAKKKEMIIQ